MPQDPSLNQPVQLVDRFDPNDLATINSVWAEGHGNVGVSAPFQRLSYEEFCELQEIAAESFISFNSQQNRSPADSPTAGRAQGLHVDAPPPPARRISVPGIKNNAKPTSNGRIYGELMRERPPACVKPPQGIAISMRELCTFFPNSFQLPKVAVRAIHSGWSAKDIAIGQLDALGMEYEDHLRQKIQKQLKEGAKLFYDCPIWLNRKGDKEYWTAEATRAEYGKTWAFDLTSNGWQLRRQHPGQSVFEHMSLVDIYSAVPQGCWPDGQDRLLLTQCLEYARGHPELDLDTSHFDWIIRKNGWSHPNVDPATHDQEALSRMIETTEVMIED